MLADVLDLGEPGGILTGSHMFGPQMRRMVDEPERRREIDAELGTSIATWRSRRPRAASRRR